MIQRLRKGSAEDLMRKEIDEDHQIHSLDKGCGPFEVSIFSEEINWQNV
jgi:hypothetical protein